MISRDGGDSYPARDLSRTPVRRLGVFKPHTAAFGTGANGVPSG